MPGEAQTSQWKVKEKHVITATVEHSGTVHLTQHYHLMFSLAHTPSNVERRGTSLCINTDKDSSTLLIDLLVKANSSDSDSLLRKAQRH